MSRVRASSLAYEYPGGVRALNGLDIELEPGVLVCLIGPNGSGKSTLLKLLGGTLTPTSGTVAIDGGPLAALAPRARAKLVASVPQVLRALPEVAVEAFVLGGRYPYFGMWGRSSPEDFEAVRTALAAADMSDLADRALSELSGGQCQRVLVARALAQRADVLLFDEPTASLDPEHQVRVFGLIASLAARGRTALVATHELNLASRYADRIVVLDSGRIVAAGPVEEILRPEVLEPVYGPHLYYGRADGTPGRPLVLPWSDEGGTGDGPGDGTGGEPGTDPR